MDVMEINNILILINSSNACELDALLRVFFEWREECEKTMKCAV